MGQYKSPITKYQQIKKRNQNANVYALNVKGIAIPVAVVLASYVTRYMLVLHARNGWACWGVSNGNIVKGFVFGVNPFKQRRLQQSLL